MKKPYVHLAIVFLLSLTIGCDGILDPHWVLKYKKRRDVLVSPSIDHSFYNKEPYNVLAALNKSQNQNFFGWSQLVSSSPVWGYIYWGKDNGKAYLAQVSMANAGHNRAYQLAMSVLPCTITQTLSEGAPPEKSLNILGTFQTNEIGVTRSAKVIFSPQTQNLQECSKSSFYVRVLKGEFQVACGEVNCIGDKIAISH